tara:strand:+ start:68 stop:775 length:708 start_codon:yes stop_codon:yes gene_type:complete
MKNNVIKEFIEKSNKQSNEYFFDYKLFGETEIFLLNPFVNDINLKVVLKKIESKIPKFYIYGLDAVYVGDFDFFRKNNTNARYHDGSIHISNDQDDEDDMVDDVVHEIAHHVENTYKFEIYSDGGLEKEFVNKRIYMESILRNHDYKFNSANFLDIEYSKEMDNFLYKDIGYEKLEILLSGLFIRPYAATSLNEYFATGFEEYYLGDRNDLKKISPRLYQKFNDIDTMGYQNERA